MVTCLMTETRAYLFCSSLENLLFRPPALRSLTCRGPMLRTPSVPIDHVNYNCQNVKDVNKNLPNGGTFSGHSLPTMRFWFLRMSSKQLRNSCFPTIILGLGPLFLSSVLLFFCSFDLPFVRRFLEVVGVDVVLCCSLRCCIAC